MKWADFEVWFCKSPSQHFEEMVKDDSLTSAFNGLSSSICLVFKFKNPNASAWARSDHMLNTTGTLPGCSCTASCSASFSSVAKFPVATSIYTLGPITAAASWGNVSFAFVTSNPPFGDFTLAVTATSAGGSAGTGCVGFLLLFRSFSRGVSASARWGWPLLGSCCRSTTGAVTTVSPAQNPQKPIQLNCIIETWETGHAWHWNWWNGHVNTYQAQICL